MKRTISIMLAAIMLLSLCQTAMAASDTEFTWIIDKGEESIFYEDYAMGPVQQWWMNQEWDADGDGAGKPIKMDFMVLPTGNEQDTLTTLISTDQYGDLMSMNYCAYNAASLYEDGKILDITEYVENYMPNYMAWLDLHPEYKNRVTITNEDGERIYVMLYQLCDIQEPAWEGWCYRRDWLVKYGTNPTTGEAFTGGYSEDRTDWTDDVVFPSGGSDPIYISDWEWMLDIFQKALSGEGISDGYAIQMYYTGFMGSGDLTSGFGGGSGFVNLDRDGKAYFSGTSENFRTYLQCLNTWFEKGYVDPAFQERSSDVMFFLIDSASVYSGKVGMWIGMQSQLGAQMDFMGSGMCVFGAVQPINDVYGGEEQKGKAPDAFYSNPIVGTGSVVTEKAKGKDLATLFTALDYMYSFEGGLLRGYGFSNEQTEQCNNEFYEKWGFNETGTYTVSTNEDGEKIYVLNPNRSKETGLDSALAALRINGMISNKNVDRGYTPIEQRSIDQWSLYTATGIVTPDITGQLNADASAQNAGIYNDVMTFMSQAVPDFITGAADIDDDGAWADYCAEAEAYNPQAYVDNINAVLE